MKQSLGAKTFLFPTPVWLVGTYDEGGRANVMTAAWGGVCCSQPPCVAVSLRKATYSYAAIAARGAFTVSIPPEERVREADGAGILSGREGDKFARLGLTPTRAEHVDAPYVEECPVVLECRLLHTVEIGLHTQFIGEIVDVKADEAVLDEGAPDIARIRPFVFDTAKRRYFGLGGYLAKAFSVGKGEN